MTYPYTIGIITWWEDGERVVSLASATEVEKALRDASFEVVVFDMPRDWNRFESVLSAQALSFVFLMIHGTWGEDGELVSVLDMYHVPYQCAARDILQLTIDKRTTKQVWRQAWLPVANDMLILPLECAVEQLSQRIVQEIGFPCVRKVLAQWSSNWVHIIEDKDWLEAVMTLYAHYTEQVLIESFLQGDEITVWLLEQPDGTVTALPITLIIPPREGGFDFANKYNGKTQEICPAPLSAPLTEQCQQLAVDSYTAVWCQKYARVDMIITWDGPVLLEINTIPGFTSQSLYPKAAQAAWIPFCKLLEHLMEVGSRR